MNKSTRKPSKREVDGKLRSIMSSIYDASAAAAEEYGLGYDLIAGIAGNLPGLFAGEKLYAKFLRVRLHTVLTAVAHGNHKIVFFLRRYAVQLVPAGGGWEAAEYHEQHLRRVRRRRGGIPST